MSEWDKLWERRPHPALTTKTGDRFMDEIKAEGDRLQAKIVKVEELASKWANCPQSPYDDAYSDPSPAVRLTRLYGLDLKAILSRKETKERKV